MDGTAEAGAEGGASESAEAVFSAIEAAPAYRLVFHAIEREILEGRLRIGDRLPTETELAHRLGVHRSTTREGLRLLEQSGLAERREGRRLYASLPRTDDLSERAQRALSLSRVSFDGLWRLLRALEPAAAALAAERIDDDTVAALEANLARTAVAVDARRSVTQLDLEFHALIADATGDAAWRLAREPSAALLFPANERMLPRLAQSGARLLTAHRNIFEAVRAGNGEGAERWMRRHIDDFRRGYVLAGFDPDEPVRPVGAPENGNGTRRPGRIEARPGEQGGDG